MVRQASLAILTLLSFASCMVINVLGGMGVIGVSTNSQLSDKYPTAITPAGWTFSIWGFIFFLQAVWTVYLLGVTFFCSRTGESADLLVPEGSASMKVSDYANALGVWLPLVWLFESLWTFAFNYEIIWLSVIFMDSILITVVIAFVRVQRIANQDFFIGGKPLMRYIHLWIAVVPTATNMCWIFVASSVNTLVAITCYAGDPGTPFYSYPQFTEPLGSVVIVLLTLGAALVAFRLMSATCPFTFVWAFNGVAAATSGMVHAAALACMGVLAGVGAIVLVLPFFPKAARAISCGGFVKSSVKSDSHYNVIEGKPIYQ